MIRTTVSSAVAETFEGVGTPVEITFPRDASHGDYATNFPLKATKTLKMPPMEIARRLADTLNRNRKFSYVTAATPGFVNMFLSPDFMSDLSETIAGSADLFSHYRVPARRINVEFVSANPTGPLTVGHGRNACLGDTLARLLGAVGHQVTREYYFNNAGRQMKVLGESLRIRYLQALGRDVPMPEESYVGEYLSEIAKDIVAREADRKATEDAGFFRKEAETRIFDIIRSSLDRLGIRFDIHFNEDSLYRDGAVERTLQELKNRNLTQPTDDGAVLFLGESVGLPKNPVLMKKTGEPTYRLPDVAYHIHKLGRGYDQIIDVLGADHIDEHREVLVMLQALGHPTESIRGLIYQFVTLVKDGKPVKMSTRKAEYVTLDELIDEVGTDAVRFFFLSRKADTHLEFDLGLAKQQSQDNPVYYIQYAHARLAGIYRTATEQGFADADIRAAHIDLSNPSAGKLARKILGLGDVIDTCIAESEVTGLLWYLRELAETFHSYYTDVRIVEAADRPGTLARLKLCGVVRKILRDTLTTMGMTAPERM